MSTTPKPETLETPLLKIEDDGLCRPHGEDIVVFTEKARKDEEREIKENEERKQIIFDCVLTRVFKISLKISVQNV